MSELLRAEIAETLSRHNLVEPQGWLHAPGVIEYECQCGELFVVDTRVTGFRGRDALLFAHQALAIEALGVRRTHDHSDSGHLEAVGSEVLRRRQNAAVALSASRACDAEMSRIEGALAELNVVADLICRATGMSAFDRTADLFAHKPQLLWVSGSRGIRVARH